MELLFIHFLLLLIPFIFFFLFLATRHKKKTEPAGFKYYPIVGSLPGFVKNRHRFLEWSTDVLAACPGNTAVFRRPGGIHDVMTANPANVEYILKTKFENYPKGKRFTSVLEDFLGDGIFNTDGGQWKMQRKTASYEFSTKSLRSFVMDTAKIELETRLIPILTAAAATGRVLDVQDILEKFAFDNINKVAFNVDPECLAGDGTNTPEFMQAFDDAANLTFGRFMYALPFMFKIKRFFKMGSEQQLQKSIRAVHKFADKIVRSRMEQKAGKDDKKDEDLLSRFMGAPEEYSPTYLRDIVTSFILAGRDTTSSALTWFFWIISSRPDVERKLLQELEKIRTKSGRKIGESSYDMDELKEMHYLHAAISEAMRLYPPVPVDSKACQKDDVMPDGTFIGKDWVATYHTYAMGRMENIWGKDCCEYKPERWLDNNGMYCSQNPFRFPVFHAGPRMCLGKEMAYIQMKSIVASILERFEIEVLLEKGQIPDYVLSLTLRMKGGLPIKVKERNV